jgi:hypothetical protein
MTEYKRGEIPYVAYLDEAGYTIDEIKDNVVDFLSDYGFIADKKDIDIADNAIYIKKIKIKKTVDVIKLNIPIENIE